MVCFGQFSDIMTVFIKNVTRFKETVLFQTVKTA